MHIQYTQPIELIIQFKYNVYILIVSTCVHSLNVIYIFIKFYSMKIIHLIKTLP